MREVEPESPQQEDPRSDSDLAAAEAGGIRAAAGAWFGAHRHVRNPSITKSAQLGVTTYTHIDLARCLSGKKKLPEFVPICMRARALVQ